MNTVWERRRQREGERVSSSDTCSLSISLCLSLDTWVVARRTRATLLLLCDGETAGKFFSSYNEAWSTWRYVGLCCSFSLALFFLRNSIRVEQVSACRLRNGGRADWWGRRGGYVSVCVCVCVLVGGRGVSCGFVWMCLKRNIYSTVQKFISSSVPIGQQTSNERA